MNSNACETLENIIVDEDVESLLPFTGGDIAGKAARGLTGVVEVVGYAAANSGIPFVELAGNLIESILKAARDHMKAPRKMKKHIEQARVKAETAEEALDGLRKRKFMQSSKSLHNFLKALKRLEILVWKWTQKSNLDQSMGFSFRKGTSLAKKYDKAFREALENLEKRQNDLQLAVISISQPSTTLGGKEDQLFQILQPIDFSSDILVHHERFIDGTREWVFKDIEEWRNDWQGSCYRVLLAGPGFGKTAVMVRYLGLHQDQILAYHLCFHKKDEKRDPIRMASSMAYQIAMTLPTFKEALQEMVKDSRIQKYLEMNTNIGNFGPNVVKSVIDALLIEPLQKVKESELPKGTSNGRYVLMIDGLDEAEVGLKNPLLNCIVNDFGSKLPKWLAVLMTSRPEKGEQFKELNPYWLSDEKYETYCQEDAKLFCKTILRQPLRLHPDLTRLETEQTLFEKSEGNFLYLQNTRERTAQSISDDNILDVRELPGGLSGLFYEQMKRVFCQCDKRQCECREKTKKHTHVMTVISVILSASRPLTISELTILAKIEHLERAALHEIIESISQLFVQGIDGRFYVFHKSFADWLMLSKPFDLPEHEHEYAITKPEYQLLDSHGLVFTTMCREKDQWSQESWKCEICANNFSLLFRWKHHCRLCGKTVCNVCSLSRQTLASRQQSHAVDVKKEDSSTEDLESTFDFFGLVNVKPMRVCNPCNDTSVKGWAKATALLSSSDSSTDLYDHSLENVQGLYWRENIHKHLLQTGIMTDAWIEFLRKNGEFLAAFQRNDMVFLDADETLNSELHRV